MLNQLEDMMLEHAKNLQFRKATLVRDDIEELKKMG
ncbi:MAG: UvrB/UvrC motif-containing protein [Spirochaetota bacterium]